MTEIERVARVIDPEAFRDFETILGWAHLKGAKHWYPLSCEDVARSTFQAREPLRVDALAKAQAILNPIKPEGWRLVPVEPTRQMLQAAGRYEDQCAVQNYGGSADLEGIWDAMIQASPPPPVAP